MELLPHVVAELPRARQPLNEVLDGVLPKPEEVGARHRVGVRPVPDVVRRANDDGPRAGRSTGQDRVVWHVGSDDLELGTITAVEDLAVVDNFDVRVDGGKIAPAPRQDEQECMGGRTYRVTSYPTGKMYLSV